MFCYMTENNKYLKKINSNPNCLVLIPFPGTVEWKLEKQSQRLVLSFCFEYEVTMPKTWMGLSCSSEVGRLPFTDPLQGRYRPLTGKVQRNYVSLHGLEQN